jgi:hypothetical protein
MDYHGMSKTAIAGNKIERGIGNTDDQIFGYASISKAKGKVYRRF